MLGGVAQMCEVVEVVRLGFPCVGTFEKFDVMTSKDNFKVMCRI